MTIHPIEHANQIAEINASRDAHADAENAKRMLAWQSRYPHDVVAVPAPVDPPSWPARRCSIRANVTTLKTGTR